MRARRNDYRLVAFALPSWSIVMDIDPKRDGAAIYRFPPGGRAAGKRSGSMETKAATAVTIPSGRGWYHDEAIREARKASTKTPDACP